VRWSHREDHCIRRKSRCSLRTGCPGTALVGPPLPAAGPTIHRHSSAGVHFALPGCRTHCHTTVHCPPAVPAAEAAAAPRSCATGIHRSGTPAPPAATQPTHNKTSEAPTPLHMITPLPSSSARTCDATRMRRYFSSPYTGSGGPENSAASENKHSGTTPQRQPRRAPTECSESADLTKVGGQLLLLVPDGLREGRTALADAKLHNQSRLVNKSNLPNCSASNTRAPPK
jgi:hypothetical protein